MTKLTDATVVYCPKCGHSASFARLSYGREDCGSTVQIISREEWTVLAKNGKLHLTEAGLRAMELKP